MNQTIKAEQMDTGNTTLPNGKCLTSKTMQKMTANDIL
jgi:hypothetical protein